MAYVRSRKAQKKALDKREVATKKVSELEAKQLELKRCFPGVAAVCGVVGKSKKRRGEMTQELAQRYIRLCFQFSDKKSYGINPPGSGASLRSS